MNTDTKVELGVAKDLMRRLPPAVVANISTCTEFPGADEGVLKDGALELQDEDGSWSEYWFCLTPEYMYFGPNAPSVGKDRRRPQEIVPVEKISDVRQISVNFRSQSSHVLFVTYSLGDERENEMIRLRSDQSMQTLAEWTAILDQLTTIKRRAAQFFDNLDVKEHHNAMGRGTEETENEREGNGTLDLAEQGKDGTILDRLWRIEDIVAAAHDVVLDVLRYLDLQWYFARHHPFQRDSLLYWLAQTRLKLTGIRHQSRAGQFKIASEICGDFSPAKKEESQNFSTSLTRRRFSSVAGLHVEDDPQHEAQLFTAQQQSLEVIRDANKRHSSTPAGRAHSAAVTALLLGSTDLINQLELEESLLAGSLSNALVPAGMDAIICTLMEDLLRKHKWSDLVNSSDAADNVWALATTPHLDRSVNIGRRLLTFLHFLEYCGRRREKGILNPVLFHLELATSLDLSDRISADKMGEMCSRLESMVAMYLDTDAPFCVEINEDVKNEAEADLQELRRRWLADAARREATELRSKRGRSLSLDPEPYDNSARPKPLVEQENTMTKVPSKLQLPMQREISNPNINHDVLKKSESQKSDVSIRSSANPDDYENFWTIPVIPRRHSEAVAEVAEPDVKTIYVGEGRAVTPQLIIGRLMKETSAILEDHVFREYIDSENCKEDLTAIEGLVFSRRELFDVECYKRQQAVLSVLGLTDIERPIPLTVLYQVPCTNVLQLDIDPANAAFSEARYSITARTSILCHGVLTIADSLMFFTGSVFGFSTDIMVLFDEVLSVSVRFFRGDAEEALVITYQPTYSLETKTLRLGTFVQKDFPEVVRAVRRLFDESKERLKKKENMRRTRDMSSPVMSHSTSSNHEDNDEEEEDQGNLLSELLMSRRHVVGENSFQEWSVLLCGASLRRCDMMEVVVSAGTNVQNLYQVARGSVRIESSPGKVLRICNEGETFNETAFLEGGVCQATAMSLQSGTRVYSISQSFSNIILKIQPKLLHQFYKFLAVIVADRLRKLKLPPPVDDELDKRKARWTSSQFCKSFNIASSEELIFQWPALHQRKLTHRGFLFISEHYIAFHSKLMGMKYQVLIPYRKIESITTEEDGHILVSDTAQKTYVFVPAYGEGASEEEAMTLIHDLWDQSRMEEEQEEKEDLEGDTQDALDDVMTRKDRENIFSGAKQVVYKKDAFILKEGNPTSALYQIGQGECRVEKTFDPYEGPRTLRIMRPGDMFGEMSFLEGGKASASVVVHGDACELYIIESEFLKSLLTIEPGLPSRFYKFLAIYISRRVESVISEEKKRKEEG